jgi:SAM-dependent methyltransferase
LNGETDVRPRLGAFSGEPIPAEPERTPSLSGWLPPPRAETGSPDYGLDAPLTVAACFSLAGLIALGGVLLAKLRVGGRAIPLMPGLAWIFALAAAAPGASLVAYAKFGKRKHRARVLDLIDWTGAERVLDIGTGGGLLMIGAAKRLTKGKAFGIDTWRAEDLTNNNRETTMRNAFLEGVVDKVDVRFEDARKLSFQSNSFDVVLSTATLHGIEPRADRDAALREIARVLRPGGSAIISDYANVAECAAALREAGLDVRLVPPALDTFTYLRTLVATKAMPSKRT